MSRKNFLDELDNVVRWLRPYGSSTTKFPNNLEPSQLRFEANETVHNWFERLVNGVCFADTGLCAIEDNIAVFAIAFWSKKKELIGANISVLVTSKPLDEYLEVGASPNEEESYFRLDYDATTLGYPFSHPLPHIHVFGHESIRFALEGSSGNVIVDFFEFVYRHFYPQKWSNWAEGVWNADFTAKRLSEDENPIYRIFKAFEESRLGVLQQHEDDLTRLKTLLRKSKDNYFKFTASESDRTLISYPNP